MKKKNNKRNIVAADVVISNYRCKHRTREFDHIPSKFTANVFFFFCFYRESLIRFIQQCDAPTSESIINLIIEPVTISLLS